MNRPLEFTPLEIMPPRSAAGLHSRLQDGQFRIIPAGFNPLRLRGSAASAPLKFLTGFTAFCWKEEGTAEGLSSAE